MGRDQAGAWASLGKKDDEDDSFVGQNPGKLNRDHRGGWASLGRRQDADNPFTGQNPMYAGRADAAAEEIKPLQRTMPNPLKRALSFGPKKIGMVSRTGDSSSRLLQPSNSTYTGHSAAGSVGPSHSYRESGYPENDTSRAAPLGRSTRRPVRAFERLDEEVYDRFLNCTKLSSKEDRAIRRMA